MVKKMAVVVISLLLAASNLVAEEPVFEIVEACIQELKAGELTEERIQAAIAGAAGVSYVAGYLEASEAGQALLFAGGKGQRILEELQQRYVNKEEENENSKDIQ